MTATVKAIRPTTVIPTAKELIEKYRKDTGVKHINALRFRMWLEQELNEPMDRMFFMSTGKGGGQKYRTLWNVVNPEGNDNAPCYFYTEDEEATRILCSQGHIHLDQWLLVVLA